jgi:deazaflavin-dependent oxidoreductase (nitroreductase family)
LLGHRFLALTYSGRKTGRVYETVLEVLRYDPATSESIAVSAYGPAAGWYRSLQAEPAVRVRTG